MNLNFLRIVPRPAHFAGSIGVAVITVAMASGCAGTKAGAPADGRAFASPDRAADALASAIRSGSPDRMKAVLGPEAEELVHSGDPVQDRNRAERFAALYDQRHELLPSDDGYVALCIGPSEWPFPIPIVNAGKSNAWKFDTARGKDEILNRRIGENELSAIQVCLAVVDAQCDYVARATKATGWPEYAQKLLSDPGKMNGLYWKTKPGEADSPLGDLVADAADEGYEPGTHQPYHGYRYHLLTAQGPSADGGAYDYLVNGKLLGGFAVVARPAVYGTSGVMTFIVNHQGVVYQRDLGPNTEELAKSLKTFDPEPGWAPVE